MLLQRQMNRELQISGILFSLAASEFFQSRIRVFDPRADEGSFVGRSVKKVSEYLSLFFGNQATSLYGTVTSAPFLRLNVSRKSDKSGHRIPPDLRSLETYSICGVMVGDLIYDEFLARSSKPTIDLSDPNFQIFFFQTVRLIEKWSELINSGRVSAVVGTHPYLGGVPLRIAAANGIPAYDVSTHSHETRFFSREKMFPRLESREYSALFDELTVTEKNNGLNEAKIALRLRLSGKKDPRLQNSKQWQDPSDAGSLESATTVNSQRNTEQGLTFFIATHNMTDAPHTFVGGVFPDFYQWLFELGTMTRHMSHRFLVKVHPDSSEESQQSVQNLCEEFPQFHMLSQDHPTKSIVGLGVEAALTCYGTVGVELPLLGVPVINCSPRNPHEAYSFNTHIESREHLRALLLDPRLIRRNIKLSEIYECFYVSSIWNRSSYFYPMSDPPENFLSHFNARCDQNDLTAILKGYSDFIDSQDYWFRWDKFGCTTNLNSPSPK